MVFTGSSNLADGGEKNNGDNLIEIRDPKVVTAYLVEAVRIFDHYLFRVREKEAKKKPEAKDLAEPMATLEDCWWFRSFTPGDDRCRDRELFID